MFLGGEYTEAVAPTDICPGLILPTGYVRLSTSGGGAASNLHSSLRSGEAPSIDSIRLLGTKPLSIEKFEAAINRGRSVLSTAPSLSPELFLSGVTHFVREQWPEALVTIWTSTEQLLSHLWEVNIRSKVSDGIPGRKAFLADYRTWPVSTRIEVLFQQGFIDESLYSQLDLARKSRNAFIHDGRTPTTASVTSAVTGMFDLLARCSKDINNGSDAIHAKEMVLTKGKLEHTPVPGQKIDEENFVAWRRIRHLPGEKGWEGEFEGFELGFKPLEEIKEIHKTANSKKSLRSKSRKA
jgi:hypothetical protein